jgi:glyoxylase-like metal-dependent hydrolase (beta-lactamase superfamily II)
MSEPPEVAAAAEQVAPGIWHWLVHNSAIGGSASSSQLVEHGDDVVLVDPVRLADDALAALPEPTAIVLTAKTHQRAAWRYRRQFGIPVHMPEGAPPADEEPDARYGDGGVLPAGLRPVQTPGPEIPHYCLLTDPEQDALICSDLLMVSDDRLQFVPLRFHDDPDATRASVRGLLDLPFHLLLLDHGPPLRDPKPLIQRVLDA